MPLTPADVANVAFSKPPLGKRGYDEDEVDAFLDVVGVELGRLIQENSGLRNQVEQLRAARVDTGPDLRPVEPPRLVMAPVPLMREQTSPSGDHNVQAARVLGLAQEMADRVTGEAKAEADGMLGEVRTRSEELLAGARAKAEGMVTEARTRADTLLNDARSRAETRDRQSREKAASLECNAARKHNEIVGSLSQEKSTLEKKIDELRTFEREYRTRLTTYLDSQLRELNGRGSTAPTGPVGNQQGVMGSGFDTHATTG
ncbi:MAG TPA: DivIVA domain-containing protein [Pseudonocardiaceae bacterium]|jgi:DivIVA domain-containing protein|nr:DivIVA domain-containing protein [Pseudonocardiaceae bacterium]